MLTAFAGFDFERRRGDEGRGMKKARLKGQLFALIEVVTGINVLTSLKADKAGRVAASASCSSLIIAAHCSSPLPSIQNLL